MKLISEEILPESKRDSSSLDDWRDAFLELEQVVIAVLDDGAADAYEIYTAQFKSLNQQMKALVLDPTKDDDPAMDVFIRMIERLKPIVNGLEYVRDHSALGRFLAEKASSSQMKYVKN